jgi:Nuclease-related domain
MKNEITRFALLTATKFASLWIFAALVVCEIKTLGHYPALSLMQYSLRLLGDAFWVTVIIYSLLTIGRALLRWNVARLHKRSKNQIDNAMQKIRVAGSSGENIVRRTISSIVKSGSIGPARFLDEQTLLFKPLKRHQRSQEIDHILLTQFGIFLIETKNYGGRLSVVKDGVLCGDGVVRQNPVIQSLSKVQRAKEFIGNDIPVHAIAVFSSDDAVLDTSFQGDMVLVSRLYSRLNEYKSDFESRGKANLDIEELYQSIFGLIESDQGAKHRHLLSIEQEEYCALQNKIAHLQNTAPRPWKVSFISSNINRYCGFLFAAFIVIGGANYLFPSHLSITVSAEPEKIQNLSINHIGYITKASKGLSVGY